MKTYVDWEFYSNTYRGNMPKENFFKLVIRASAEIKIIISNRDISWYEKEIQFATCSVADLLYKIENLEGRKYKLSNDEKILTSESVGDLHRTYANPNTITDLDNEIAKLKSKIYEEVKVYLADTGLMYRGG